MNHRARRLRTLLWGLVVPHSFVLIARAMRARVLAPRRLELFAASTDARADGDARAFDYEEAVGLLVAMGCGEEAVRSGSIQDGSLEFIRETVQEQLPSDTPLQALHVGNFVGLSLASLTSALVKRNRASTVISIDPNIQHAGIQHTQTYTLALLTRFGLQHNSLLICGYSLEKVPGNDGIRSADYEPLTASEVACENTLVSLDRLGARFSVVVMDGHHEASYLRRELGLVQGMLEEGGLLFLDDVSAVWKGIRELFKELGEDDSIWALEQIGYDGRVGALRKRVGIGDNAPAMPGGAPTHRLLSASNG
jgi:Methyltransferase domain